MIGLDTNVLVRYIVQDDVVQQNQSKEIIESLSQERPGFIPVVCIVELVWVLKKGYGVKKPEILKVLERVFRVKQFVIEHSDILWQAFFQFSKENVDFSDCVIERCAHAAHCEYTVTFDKNAAKLLNMKLIS